MWDPSGLQLTSVTPAAASSSKDLDVTLTVEGAGFGLAADMRACLVNLENPFDKQGIIPCNDLTVVKQGVVTVRICPRNKRTGNYQLVWWLLPPPNVVDPATGAAVPNVPVNDVQVLGYALLVAP